MALLGNSLGSSTPGFDVGSFRAALKRFSSDPEYVTLAIGNPSMILEDFPDLTMRELDALRDAAILSGVDTSSIDPFVNGVTSRTTNTPLLGGDGCCCCCCCGLTGVVRRG